MRPGSRECCDTPAAGMKLDRCGATTLTSVGKVAGAIAQGVAQTPMQSWRWDVAPRREQSAVVAQPAATLAVAPQGEMAIASAG